MAALVYPAIPNKSVQIRSYPMKTNEAIVEGSCVLIDASGLATVAGADPALIAGFALHGAGTGTSAILEVDIYAGDQLVALAYPGSTFWLGASAQLAVTDVGVQYGINKDATTGIWYVDLTDTTTTRVTIEKVDLTRFAQGLAEVSVMAANRQFGN